VSPDQRAEMEARADRARRRGEMAEAVQVYREILAAFPGDEAIQGKLALLQESLQPMELTSAKAPPAPRVSGRPMTVEEEGERLFALGDYAGAAAANRRALHEKPDSPLIQERLLELYRLAQTAPRHSPTDSALPSQPEPLLNALLDRIVARKRVPR
jgi:tetratricopeptide (TPR) repeat protein